MRKLVLTLIGKDSEIASAKEYLEEYVGISEQRFIKSCLDMDQIDYLYRDEEYVVHVADDGIIAIPCGDSLEKALRVATNQIAIGHDIDLVTIDLCSTTYLNDVFDGVNRVKSVVIRMKNTINEL